MSSCIESYRTQLEKREISVVELTQHYLEQIRKHADLGAFIHVCEEEALKQAVFLDKLNQETKTALGGIPMSLKDNICTKGMKTTCASQMLSNFIPPYDATVVEKLKKSGAVLLGKNNMDEFGMGNDGKHSFFGEVQNPHDRKKIPGGSSSGGAVAVAAHLVPYALGSDTGGSIRQPASLCGVYGLKPTYGRVSRSGLIAFASSLDQIGILAGGTKDCAYVLESIAGKDSKDHTTVEQDCSVLQDLKKGVRGMKIALPEEFLEFCDSDVKQAILQAAMTYEALGAAVVPVSFSSLQYAVSAYYILSSAEASSNLSRFDGVRYGYRTKSEISDMTSLYTQSRSEGLGMEVKRRIVLGTFGLSEGYYDRYYKKAQTAAMLIRREFASVFSDFDLMLTPVTPFSEKGKEEWISPVQAYQLDCCTVPVNLAGLPAMSVPCGKNTNGMPIGMQLIGKHFEEKTILRAAYAFETICEG